jgi:hypothetical protein
MSRKNSPSFGVAILAKERTIDTWGKIPLSQFRLFSKDRNMTAITPKAKAPKASPATSPKISTAYSKLITAGANAESAKSNFNVEAIEFVIWLDAQRESVEIKKATISALSKDLTFSMPVKASHVQVTGTAVHIITKYGRENKVSEILTLAKRINSEVGVDGAIVHIGKFATFQELKDGTKSTAEIQAEKAEAKPAKDAKVLGLAQIFQKTIKEAKKLDLTKVKLEGLDIQYLIEMNKILAIVAKNSGLDKAKA